MDFNASFFFLTKQTNVNIQSPVGQFNRKRQRNLAKVCEGQFLPCYRVLSIGKSGFRF